MRSIGFLALAKVYIKPLTLLLDSPSNIPLITLSL